MSVNMAPRKTATREALDLSLTSRYYASGRKDSEPEKYSRLNVELFTISSINAHRIAKENGLESKWNIQKFFNEYTKALAS